MTKKPQVLFLHGEPIIFESNDGDYYCVANKEGDHIHVLYEGHSREHAYESIFEELDLTLKVVKKDMSDGSFVPTKEDWK